MAAGATSAGTMRAAVLHSTPGDLEIEDLVIDVPGPREVLVRTTHAGLCHSDLHFMEGLWPLPMAAVMGHESAGVVEAVGSEVTHVEPGDHVIACVSIFCGQCRYCLSGRPHLCEGRSQLVSTRSAPSLTTTDGQPVMAFAGLGGFAEAMLVHEHGVVKIRPDMPLDKAALIGCGVTTGLGAAIRTAAVRPGESAAVVGCGGIGLSAIQGCRIAGASPIIAVDVVDSKLEAAAALGATHTVNSSTTDPVEAVKELTGGGVEHAFEAIGLKATTEQCWHMLAPGGTATIIGMLPLDAVVEIPGADIFVSEKKLQGSLMGSNRFRIDMPQYIELYLDGRLKLDEMVTGTIALDEINEGYARMKAGDTLRTVIEF